MAAYDIVPVTFSQDVLITLHSLLFCYLFVVFLVCVCFVCFSFVYVFIHTISCWTNYSLGNTYNTHILLITLFL